jgi:hypothetical protein
MKKFFSRAQALKSLFKGDLQHAMVKSYANHLLKKWDRFNKDFYYKLKHELYGELNTQIGKIAEKLANLEKKPSVGGRSG